MRKFIILIAAQILILSNSISQNKITSLDSLESSFERLWKDIKMPCDWEMIAKRNINGRLTFFDKNSTGLEFDFFKVYSLPFYSPAQTNFETIEKYYSWKSQKVRSSKKIALKKIEQNESAGYVIFKIKDASGEFYRIFARNNDIVCSIKIFNKVMPLENQLDKLKVLYELNKN